MSAAPESLQHAGAGASRTLARHVAGDTYARVPAEVTHAFKRTLLDFLACAVSGAAMPVSRALLGYYLDSDATRIAAVIGAGSRLSAANAALVTGANTHGLDFDDGFTAGSSHPGGVIYPAVLSQAQQHGSSPADIMRAVIAGYDVMLRLAAAMHPATARRGFHNTPLAGVFGAAAACASLLRLDEAQALHAIGMAGSFSAGIREYLDEGAEIKRIHPGKAARDGLLCAEYARHGITGPSRILEGAHGFFRTHVDAPVKWEALLGGLGERFEIASAYFKPYPCCRHYQSIIDGIKDLRATHPFSAADVEHIDLGLYAVGAQGHDHQEVESLLEAQMSAPCAAALAVVLGDVAAPMFLPETLDRDDVKAVMKRTTTRTDDECERIYPGVRSGVVRIALRDGRALEKRVIHPKGEKANPMTDRDLEEKLIANCEPLIGRARCDALLGQVWGFDKLESAADFYRWP